jgi:hypothetical protein
LRRAQTKIGMRDENGADAEQKPSTSVTPVRPA